MKPLPREFLEFWVENSVHAAEQYGTPGGEQRASELATRCIEAAKAEGLTEADLTGEVGDLVKFMREASNQANDKEKSRRDRHRL